MRNKTNSSKYQIYVYILYEICKFLISQEPKYHAMYSAWKNFNSTL
jgi:hypothetical protein